MSLKDDALQLAVVTAVVDRATEIRDELRAKMLAELQATGADATTAELLGAKVAKVSAAGGKAKVAVTDEQALTSWVADRYPDEVQQVTTTSVRSSFTTALLARCELVDDKVVDTTTGELVDGLGVRVGREYVSTRFDPAGRQLIADALAHGDLRLDLNTTPELPAGSTDKEDTA